MDRNSILGILLIASILIIWGIVQSPNKKEQEARKRVADSLALVRQAQALPDSAALYQQPATAAPAVPAGDSLSVSQLKNSLGEFAALASGENKFYVIENDLIKLTVSAKGGRPYSVELKQYRTFGKQPIVLFDGDSTQFGLTFYYQNKTISTNNLFFPPGDTLPHNASAGSDSLAMRLALAVTAYI